MEKKVELLKTFPHNDFGEISRFARLVVSSV